MDRSVPHATLRPVTNVVLTIVWLLLATYAWWASPTRPLGFLAAGAIAGVLAGGLQRAALRIAAPQFREASTALEVRRVLRGTKPGTAYLYLFWVFQVCAVIVPLFLRIGTGEIGSAFGPVVAYASFAFCREGMTLGPAFRLARG